MGLFDQTTTAFVVTRAVHYCACLLLVTAFAFEMLVLSPLEPDASRLIATAWRRLARVLVLVCVPLALVSGAAWFGLVAVDMSGSSWHDTIKPDVLSEVWSQTQFGHVWQVRGIFWLIAMAAGCVALFSPPRLRGKRSTEGRRTRVYVFDVLGLMASAALCGSLAWAGHGSAGPWPQWHLAADVIHLVISGFWPAGLLPFAWLLLVLRRSDQPQARDTIATLTRRFSAVSFASVLLLATSGLVNSWILLGSIANLFHTAYGKMLLLKIALFVAMVLLGATNLLYLKPQITRASPGRGIDSSRFVGALQLSVAIELVLGILVIVVVGMLGLLPPGAE